MPTNFTAVRVKRDILRRSSVGGILTNRSVSLAGDGSNQAYGVDGIFSFYDRFLTQMCARFSPSRSAAPWEEGADALVPANQR